MKPFIPKKYCQLVFSALTAFMMSFIMSAFITYKNIGIQPDFIFMWMSAWRGAFFVALPISFFIMPHVRKIVDKITYTS